MKPTAAQAVVDAIRTVLSDTGRTPGAIDAAMRLAGDIGLDSLDLAQTIVLLERSLGVDPLRNSSAATRPMLRTVSDLISLYESALASP